jgi:hypothetical protein
VIRSAAAAAAALALVAAPAATASSATPAEVASLAARAGSDPQALAALRQIDRVGGRRVDLASALAASGPELAARLRVLAASSAASEGTRTDAHSSARSILSERRFRGSSVPRPLHRPLEWLGRELRRIFDAISSPLPGGGNLFWTIVAALVVAVAAYVAARLGKRRAGRIVELGQRGTQGDADDPRRLEHEAARAERDGEFELALRLRFQAGLLRLGQRRALPTRASLTNGEIGRRLRSDSFRGLARDFDEVVYGHRPAAAEDLDRARVGWPRVLEEATRA